MTPRLHRKRLLRSPVFALAASILTLSPMGRAAEEFWVGGSGLWSDHAHWLDGSAPPVGGDPALAIKILNPQGASVTAELDMGHFQLNSLTVESRLSSLVYAKSIGPNQL